MILRAPAAMATSIQAFITAENIPVEVVSHGPCAVEVVCPDGSVESTLESLQAGGWIPCETARALAMKLRISTRQVGELLDLLQIKVRDCGLGCF